MPPGQRGAISGIATTTKGLGLIFGPLLAGILIDLAQALLAGHRRLPASLADPGRPLLLAVPLVFSLIKAEEASSVVPADS